MNNSIISKVVDGFKNGENVRAMQQEFVRYFDKSPFNKAKFVDVKFFGNYYILQIDHVHQGSRHFDHAMCICDKYGKNFNAIVAGSGNIFPLDSSNILVLNESADSLSNYLSHIEIKYERGETKYIYHNSWQDGICYPIYTPELKEQGLTIIHHQDKEFLYSIKNKSFLSYGFSSINPQITNQGLMVTLDIYPTDLDYGMQSHPITEFISYIGLDGQLTTPFVDLQGKMQYSFQNLPQNEQLVRINELIIRTQNNLNAQLSQGKQKIKC